MSTTTSRSARRRHGPALLLVLGLCVGTASAVAATHNPVHDAVVDADALSVRDDGIRLYRGRPFTGTAVTYHEPAPGRSAVSLAQSTDFVDGRRHGVRLRWYPTGQLASRTHYRHGRLHGLGESFWDNGNRRTQTTYDDGYAHGTSTHWYREGMKFKERTLVDGQEQGLQRAWRRNGTLYANYEVVNGRNYGRRPAELCFEVEAP